MNDDELPLFKDRSVLDGYLLHTLGFDECSVVLDLIKFGSPWSLLKIFLESSFVGDYQTRDAKGRVVISIPNDEICWHLMAIVQALRDKTSDLSLYYGERFTRPFFFGKGHKNKKGQAKLMFSLLFFCLDVVKRGYNTICVLGGGEGYGGQNHYNVARILDNMNIAITMTLYDPLLFNAEHEIGTVKIITKQRSVEGHEQFDCPVYCDIMDNSQWQVLQESVEAPVKMMKYINGPYVPGAFIQPYSHEMRIFDTDIIPSVLEGLCHDFEFLDTCVHCMLWRSLCVRYGVSEQDIIAEIVDLNVRPCRRVAGAGLMLNESDSRKTNVFRLQQRELVKEKKLFSDRQEIVLEPTIQDRVLLNYFKSLKLFFVEKIRNVHNLLCKDTSMRSDNSENCIVYDVADIDFSFPNYYYICDPGSTIDATFFEARGYVVNDCEDLHYCLVYHIEQIVKYPIYSIDFKSSDVKFCLGGDNAQFFGFVEKGNQVAIVRDGGDDVVVFAPRNALFMKRLVKLNFNSWLSKFGSKFSMLTQFQQDALYICYTSHYSDVMHDARPVVRIRHLCLVIYDNVIKLCDISFKKGRDHRPGRVRQTLNLNTLISFLNLVEKG